MSERENGNTWDKNRLIVEVIAGFLCAIIGGWVEKSSNNTYFYNGQKMSEVELSTIMEDNANYKSNNDTLEKENSDLKLQLEKLKKSISRKNEEYNELLQYVSELENYLLNDNFEVDSVNTPLSVSYILAPEQTSKEGVDLIITATTSFPAKRVTISSYINEREYGPLEMEYGDICWWIKPNFYEKGTHTVTVTAYPISGEAVIKTFTYTY